ncbi:uncharacterized protein ARMOST_18229 [Armillaria ostoyae]|uniref:Uncharacterized protein n=1 Tax=Armillaria ostoyae TaxID=47428 RepID=A0A284S175_ARMOS|nr:uncharacterized protein ARMOST_18229 [Armillaria ostoyae]
MLKIKRTGNGIKIQFTRDIPLLRDPDLSTWSQQSRAVTAEGIGLDNSTGSHEAYFGLWVSIKLDRWKKPCSDRLVVDLRIGAVHNGMRRHVVRNLTWSNGPCMMTKNSALLTTRCSSKQRENLFNFSTSTTE